MSEYWKSTPKYWCKFCSTYVKDTKFEKQQHEATGKHIGSVQRSLRGIHREHEREERDKQRAKSEVARLNGLVSGNAPEPATRDAPKKRTAAPQLAVAPQQVNVQERKRQLAQLAEMGVAIPQEFRGEMAMAGDWVTTPNSKAGEAEDQKPESRSFGVKKRKFEGQEEEEEAGEAVIRKGWGSTLKEYRNAADDSVDLDALMAGSKPGAQSQLDPTSQVEVKREDNKDDPEVENGDSISAQVGPTALKADEETPLEVPVVFKKRKSKAAKVGPTLPAST